MKKREKETAREGWGGRLRESDSERVRETEGKRKTEREGERERLVTGVIN